VSTGIKHLVTCRCVLPQFRMSQNPPQHQFVVFSVVGDDGTTVPKFAQCNNCGVIHRVTEINRSEVVSGREDMRSIPTIDDIKLDMPPRLADLLETNSADLATWEAVQHVLETKQWGSFAVLTTDEEVGLRQGKYVRIMGENLFKVETFEREEVIK